MNPRNLVVALAFCAALAPAMAAEPTRDAPAVLASLDAVFEKFMREQHVPGLVYGVVVDGKLARVRAFGVRDVARARRSPPTLRSASPP